MAGPRTLFMSVASINLEISVLEEEADEIYKKLDEYFFRKIAARTFIVNPALTKKVHFDGVAHFNIEADPRDQEKISEILLRFCKEENLVYIRKA